MVKYIHLLVFLTTLLALGKAEHPKLNCGDLNPTVCKTKFEELLESRLLETFTETYKLFLEQSYDFYSNVLKDLPENGQFAIAVKKHIDVLGPAISKLTKNVDFETLKSILLEIGQDYDPDLTKVPNFNEEESRKAYRDLFTKHNFEEYFSSRDMGYKNSYDQIIGIWNDLFAQLRPTDLETYSEYKEINADFQASEYYNTGKVMMKAINFFNLPLLKNISLLVNQN